MKGKYVGFGILGALVLILMMFVGSYNGLVKENETVTSKWSQVENQLQRRSDLIPNLVNTVKGYASHEKGAIEAVANARAKMAGAQTPVQKAEASGELSGALSRLLMVSENYPTLKADKQFKALMDELAGTENRLAVARKDYNDSVQGFNAHIKTFPASIVAGMGGFSAKEYFKVSEEAKKNPEVKF